MTKWFLRIRHSHLNDYFRIVSALSLALLYLGLPIFSALGQSLAIVTQGATGALLLNGLLRGTQRSGLYLLGPGLIVGSAVALLVFNVLGRGLTAEIGVWAVGIASAATLLKHARPEKKPGLPIWILCNLFGLTALSLSWEFPELVLVAAGLFGVSIVTYPRTPIPRWSCYPVGIVAAASIISPLLLRQAAWWIVSDDYSFFEMLSRHLTVSGPLAEWGAVNFRQYHWLPYAWSGLVNLLGGHTPAFLTLSLTMPLVYTSSLCASLMMMIERVFNGNLSLLRVIPLWSILSLNILDWSGTSTAGVYAVSAAAAAIMTTILDSRLSLIRRLSVWSLLIPIVVLTKLPSFFLICVMIFLCEFLLFARFSSAHRLLLTTNLVALGGFLILVPIIWWLGIISDGYSIASINPALGSPPNLNSLEVGMGVAAQKVPLLLPVLVTALFSWRRGFFSNPTGAVYFLIGLAPLAMIGVLLDVVISGNSGSFAYGTSSRFQYFSGPMYFAGSLALINLSAPLGKRGLDSRAKIFTAFAIVATVGGGFLWRHFALNQKVVELLSENVANWDSVTSIWLSFMLTDYRIGATLAALVIVWLGAKLNGNLQTRITAVFITPILILTVLSYGENARESFRRERLPTELGFLYGPPRNREIGLWLKQNTARNAIIATNSLISVETQAQLPDFSLSTWSEREFLVLGLSFLPVFGDIEAQIELSFKFGQNPTSDLARELIDSGVTWFLVDRRIADFPDWDESWDVRFRNDDFVVVKLAPVET